MSIEVDSDRKARGGKVFYVYVLIIDSNVRWQIASFRPGNNPIEALAAAIAKLKSRSADGNLQS